MKHIPAATPTLEVFDRFVLDETPDYRNPSEIHVIKHSGNFFTFELYYENGRWLSEKYKNLLQDDMRIVHLDSYRPFFVCETPYDFVFMGDQLKKHGKYMNSVLQKHSSVLDKIAELRQEILNLENSIPNRKHP